MNTALDQQDIAIEDIVIEIGGLPLRLRAGDPEFLRLLETRYAGFIGRSERAEFEFDVDLIPPDSFDPEADMRVVRRSGRWRAERGDFQAEWDAAEGRGRVCQSANPYSIDAVLRIVHTLVLSRRGGFLVHAASAVRNGRAFLFAGVSGAGKTTMARLAPAGVRLLTDEISYVRKQDGGYFAFGTPFTGEMGQAGENISAPIGALYLLAKGAANRIEPVRGAEAVQALLANILFFADDAELVRLVFQSACDFAARVPIYRLHFVPDATAWELIA